MIQQIWVAVGLLLPCVSLAQPAARYEVLITEIMADPTPAVGLPHAEYIELKNESGRNLNLQGWRLTTSTSRSGAFPNFDLPADSFVILTTASQAAALTSFGKVLAVPNFPALVNDGTTLSLIAAEGQVIHAVSYTRDWYGNAVKAEGGWSLEMMDLKNPCTGRYNWKASTSPNGGTPGRTNSVNGHYPDETPPALQNAHVLNDTTLVITFDEPVDSATAVVLTHYRFHPALTITKAMALNPLLQQVQLQLATPISAEMVYTLTVQNVTDCSGLSIGSNNQISIGQPQAAAAGDVVINEILFNPKPNGKDYLELFNRSNKVIDAGLLSIASRNGSGSIAFLKKLSETPYYLFPGDYVVLTEDANSLSLQYFVPNPHVVITLSSLPSWPDQSGTAVLVNLQGDIIDELHYRDDWHFALLRDREGVALERTDPHKPTQDKTNWHSAASSAGYGTPGYKNSQYQPAESNKVVIDVQPKIFSPDNDGYEDVTTVQYQLAESGLVANVFIFDASGRQVRHLVKNALLNQKGEWKWDGLNEKGQRLPIGTYIIYTEVFNLQGKKQHFKNTLTLARKLN